MKTKIFCLIFPIFVAHTTNYSKFTKSKGYVFLEKTQEYMCFRDVLVNCKNENSPPKIPHQQGESL
jgi:hypothetical protein